MRKTALILAAALAAICLTGCGSGGASSSAPASASSSAGSEPLHLEKLNVELYREDGGEDALLTALRELPEKLKTALAEQDVTVDRVEVTVGSSCSATCQALKEGNIDLAFLPADSFAALDGGKAILAAGTAGPDADGLTAWTGTYEVPEALVGNRALLCASGTDYGKNLAEKAASGGDLTWDELDHARWGVLGKNSQCGYQCLELWLEDRYEDSRVTDLSNVTEYASWEELLTAAAAGKIDVFPVQADIRGKYTDVWPEILTRSQVLAVTDPLYTWVAAATPELQGTGGFSQALEKAVNTLREDETMRRVLGADPYAAVSDGALDGMRRLEQHGGEE